MGEWTSYYVVCGRCQQYTNHCEFYDGDDRVLMEWHLHALVTSSCPHALMSVSIEKIRLALEQKRGEYEETPDGKWRFNFGGKWPVYVDPKERVLYQKRGEEYKLIGIKV